MFSSIRKRVTFVNVAVTLALVFAMSGGAYAAKKYLITSTKQISPSVLKALVGKTGPAGAQGPAGTAGSPGLQGPAGKDGTNGTNGKDGANGNDGAQGATGPAGATGPKGAAGTAGAPGAQGATGPTGSPWTLGGTLPVGDTETGAWSGMTTAEVELEPGLFFHLGISAISFPIPLASALTGSNVKVVAKGATPPLQCENAGHAGTAGPGNPEATSGFLCVYIAGSPVGGEVLTLRAGSGSFELGASTTGDRLEIVGSSLNQEFWGTFAVTG